MAEKLMWATMMSLSTHMWDDEMGLSRGWYWKSRYNENNNVDLDVWVSSIAFAAKNGFDTVLIDVGDAVRFESHPEVAAPDAWEKDFLKKKLDEIRALGMTPIPKLNFSMCHATWMKEYRHCVSTPKYYTFCEDVIKETYELFGKPSLFHIGWDEETYDPMKYLSFVVLRQGEQYWRDFDQLIGVCDHLGVRPWMWSDNYWWGNAAEYLKHVPKSVLQSNWYYSSFVTLPAGSMYDRTIRTYEEFAKHGYEQVPTSSCCSNKNNHRETMTHCKKVVTDGLVGYLDTTWYMTCDICRYTILDDMHRFALARKEVYPESL